MVAPRVFWLGSGEAHMGDLPEAWEVWAQSTFEPTLPNACRAVLSPFTVSWTESPDFETAQGAAARVHPIDEAARRWAFSFEYFRAEYDADAQHIEVEVGPANDPQLTLANVLRFCVSLRLPLESKGLMLHASSGGLARGVVFAGVSTAGKSTLSLGFEGVEYYSDDISLVTFDDDNVWLTGSPFYGLYGKRGVQKRVPLAAFCLLSKSDDDVTHVQRLNKSQALAQSLRHVVSFSDSPVLAQALLDQLARLVEAVPFFSVVRSLQTPSDDVFAQVMTAVEEAA